MGSTPLSWRDLLKIAFNSQANRPRQAAWHSRQIPDGSIRPVAASLDFSALAERAF